MSEQETELTIIPGWPLLAQDLMSNFDHEVNEAVAQNLRDQQVIATYPGADFYAYCWFADGLFHAAVTRHHIHRVTIVSETPEGLMDLVCTVYGRD